MTRNGKIAQLSKNLREELNERLDDGHQGKELVKWLNSLPEVQNQIRFYFRGQPISEQNLSQWRNGGYRDWQEAAERWHMVHQLREEAEEMGRAADPEETQRHLSVMFTLELGRALRDLLENTTDVKERVQGLDRLIGRFAQLRREESHARRVDMEWRIRRSEMGAVASGGFGLGSTPGLWESEPEEAESESPAEGTVNGVKDRKKSPDSTEATGTGGKKPKRTKGKTRPAAHKARSKQGSNIQASKRPSASVRLQRDKSVQSREFGPEQSAQVSSSQGAAGVPGQPGQPNCGESNPITPDQSSAVSKPIEENGNAKRAEQPSSQSSDAPGALGAPTPAWTDSGTGGMGSMGDIAEAGMAGPVESDGIKPNHTKSMKDQ